MATRNYWLEASIEGRATNLSGGPRSKDGGMSVSVKMRDQGSIMDAVRIDGLVMADGTLTLMVYNKTTGESWQIETKR